MVGLLFRYQRWYLDLDFRMFEAKCSRTKVLRKPHCVASVCPQVLHLHRSEWKGTKLIKVWKHSSDQSCFMASLAMGPQSIRQSHLLFFAHWFIKDVRGCLLVSRVTQKPFWTPLVAQMVKSLPASAGDSGWIPGWGRSAGEGNGYPLQYSCLGKFMDRGVWRAIVHWEAKVRHDWAANTLTFHFLMMKPHEGIWRGTKPSVSRGHGRATSSVQSSQSLFLLQPSHGHPLHFHQRWLFLSPFLYQLQTKTFHQTAVDLFEKQFAHFGVYIKKKLLGLPRTHGKESTYQCRRHGRCRFSPWVAKIPCRRKWQPTPVLPWKSHGQRSCPW